MMMMLMILLKASSKTGDIPIYIPLHPPLPNLEHIRNNLCPSVHHSSRNFKDTYKWHGNDVSLTMHRTKAHHLVLPSDDFLSTANENIQGHMKMANEKAGNQQTTGMGNGNMRCDILPEARGDNLGAAARCLGVWNGALQVKWCEVRGGGLILKALFWQGCGAGRSDEVS